MESGVTGKLIFIEGPDGVGKTTTIESLKAELDLRPKKYEFLSFPGRAMRTLGNLIYEIHHDPIKFGVAEMSGLSKQALHIAAHLDAIERIIGPKLDEGTNIILDRFWWSTLVYGSASGANPDALLGLVEAEKILWGARKPALAILLDREAPIERDDRLSDWLKLRAAYRVLADKERDFYPVRIIENATSHEDTVSQILNMIDCLATP
jgi:thymidylate kinase